MRNCIAVRGCFCALLLSLCGAASALSVTSFTAADPGVVAGGAFPNSAAARAAFIAATDPIATLHNIDFESAPAGFFGSLTLAPGVDAILSNADSAESGIATNSAATLGFNTTSGGSQLLRVSPIFGPTSTASLEFTFATPIIAFGAYLTDTEASRPGDLTVTYTDGGTETIPVVRNATAGVQFFGFSKPGANIVSVRFDETGLYFGNRDIWGIDDVIYAVADPTAPANAVPTPAAVWSGGALMLGLLSWRTWRRRKSA